MLGSPDRFVLVALSLSLSLRILGTTSSLLGLLGSVYVPNSVSRSEVCFLDASWTRREVNVSHMSHMSRGRKVNLGGASPSGL